MVDFGELFGNVEDAIGQAVQDVKDTGLPMLQSSLEQWGIDVLTKQNQQTQATVDQNLKEILNRPSDPNGLGGYLSRTMQSPIMQNYGGLIIGGVVVVGIVAVVLFSKRGK